MTKREKTRKHEVAARFCRDRIEGHSRCAHNRLDDKGGPTGEAWDESDGDGEGVFGGSIGKGLGCDDDTDPEKDPEGDLEWDKAENKSGGAR